ncbi:hypothetical protein FMK90_11630 [Klebsiella grimontii]|jgi:hypothetical protein|uniref:Uncharacterized protein n=1 Tax=Klebsiella grimontii TaxID=2058152 RepID=A0A285B838_9ENTR|nr:hypothetical protein [Salmonella enterica subsp. enterica serovar Larochelle]MBX4740660.1 hypothetical protein [Klebsiella sp. CVUAS 10975.2]MBX4758115.1 hypothetical protein [Klebsiella sp. CVUAS 8534.2]MBX4775712.1 hypothetical protein [Klebsiella sp. CVUAS 10191.3]MBZ6569542.1 hypothetical protein [Klebsiella grimontii]RFP48707.1 hypothetical protein DDJ34_06310 [Klebsiella oxytoca]
MTLYSGCGAEYCQIVNLILIDFIDSHNIGVVVLFQVYKNERKKYGCEYFKRMSVDAFISRVMRGVLIR